MGMLWETYNKLGFCWVCWVTAGVGPRTLNSDNPVVPVAVEGAGVGPNNPELGAVDVAGAGVDPNSPKLGAVDVGGAGVDPNNPELGAVDVAGAGVDPNRPRPGTGVVAPAVGVVPPKIPPVEGAEVVVAAAGVVPPKSPEPVAVPPAAGAVPNIPLLGWVDVLGVLKRVLVSGVLRLKKLLPEVVPGPWGVGLPLHIYVRHASAGVRAEMWELTRNYLVILRTS